MLRMVMTEIEGRIVTMEKGIGSQCYRITKEGEIEVYLPVNP